MSMAVAVHRTPTTFGPRRGRHRRQHLVVRVAFAVVAVALLRLQVGA